MELVELRAAFERLGIRRVKVGGFDIDGVLRGKYVSLDKFWSALDERLRLLRRHLRLGHRRRPLRQRARSPAGTPATPTRTRASISSTFRVLPWEPDTAAFLVDFANERRHAAPRVPALAPQAASSRAPTRSATHATFAVRVRVLPLQGDAASRCTRRASATSTPLTPGHVRLLVGARRAERRALPRDPRRDERVRHRDRRRSTPRPAPASTRSRSATTTRSARPTRRRSSRRA